MKRISALFLTVVIFLSVLTACSENKNDYIINSNDTITIGTINVSEEVMSGVNYAAELAHTVNIDKPYELEVISYNADTEEDINQAVSDLISKNVAAIICEGQNKEITDFIINATSDNNSVPLIFVDCFSDAVYKTDNAFSISIPYSYQASAVASHLISEGKTKGAVVCFDDNDYYKNFADIFQKTFSSGTNSVATYYYSGEEANFNANTIASAAYEFVFVIGNTENKIKIHTDLISAGVTSSYIFSEVADKNSLEYSEYNDIVFLSKFESDDNNYIGTDFINTYAKYNNVSVSDVTANIAYGYDVYMTIYDSLVSMNKNQSSIFQTTEATENNESTDILTSDVKNAIKDISHMGVTDVIKFSENGLTTPSFVYTDRIENAHAGMLSRYNYNNEQN